MTSDPLYEVRTAGQGRIYHGPSLILAARLARHTAMGGHRAWLAGGDMLPRCYLPQLALGKRWWYLRKCPSCRKRLMSPLSHVKSCRICHRIHVNRDLCTVFEYVTLYPLTTGLTGREEIYQKLRSVADAVNAAVSSSSDVRLKIGLNPYSKWSLKVYKCRVRERSRIEVLLHDGWTPITKRASVRWRK